MSTETVVAPPDIAAIFDMDGVLVDSVGLNWQAMNQALAPYKVTVGDAEIARYLGRTLEDQVTQLNSDYHLNLDYKEFEATTNQIKTELFTELRPKEGVRKLLDILRGARVPMAVATSMPRVLTLHRLATIDILTYFDVVVTAEDVTAHKPNPEVYQRAATLLGIDASQCVAFEDAPAGNRAAKAARMRCIAIATPYVLRDQLEEADLITASIGTVDLRTISSLLMNNTRQE
jgi:HAD superfamily hydrolase (TIGR01509 family)